MDLAISVLTNAVFVGIATIVLNYFLNKNLEKMKSSLQLEQLNIQEMLNKKRAVYIELVESMSIFIGERIPNQEQELYKRKFLNAYDTSWLWASDAVLKALSEYMALKLDPTTEAEEKAAFSKLVLEMMKDLGFLSSQVTTDDYKFINL